MNHRQTLVRQDLDRIGEPWGAIVPASQVRAEQGSSNQLHVTLDPLVLAQAKR